MPRARLLLAILAAAVAGLPAVAAAQTGVETATASGIVVRGRVAGAVSRWDAAGTLHTYVTIDVTERIVGDALPARLVLRQLGGESHGIGLWVAGQAGFAAEEDVLLDLDVAADGALRTRGLGRGKWRVAADPASGRLEATHGAGDGARTVAYEALVAALRRERVPAGAFRPVPAEFVAPLRQVGPLYEFLPTEGGFPARWHEVDGGTPVFVDHPSALPGSWSGGSPADVGDAVTLWRGSGMELDLRDGGASLPAGQCPALAFTGNGRIAVAYAPSCDVPDWVVGGGYYTTADLRTVNGVTFQKFVQGFVMLASTGPHTSSGGCFQDAVTHGLGHALGLGHSSVAGAIMNAAPPSGCASGASGLGADDLAGITTIYEGIPSAAAPPDAPTALSATAVLTTVTLAWTPASTGGAAQRYLIDAGTAPGVYNIGSIPVNAPATSTAVANVPAGTYYVRVRASNVLGTSPPSPEQSVTVGACAAPGPPASFSGTTTDTVVNLQWTPGSGVVQGYQLEAGTAPGLANLAVVPFPATTTAFAASVPYGTYYTRLRATNVCGAGAPSSEVVLNVQPCTAAPATPTGLTAGVSAGVVTLQWTAAPGAAATSYTLLVGSAPGAADILVYPTGTAATTLGAPAPRGTYHVRVVATNPCGQSAPSSSVTVVVP